jgi:hypothetical protein
MEDPRITLLYELLFALRFHRGAVTRLNQTKKIQMAPRTSVEIESKKARSLKSAPFKVKKAP